MSSLLEKLESIEKRYEVITADLGKPEVVSDPAEYQKQAKRAPIWSLSSSSIAA